MLRRHKYKISGPYNEYELRDIYNVSQFLYSKVVTGDKTLDELEKDYVKYSSQVFWHYTKYQLLVGSIVFITSDMIYPISTWKFFPRMFIKFFTSFLIIKSGISLAYQKILEFPLLDDVIANGVIKYTNWVDISNSDY
jgi:hypothetical protein